MRSSVSSGTPHTYRTHNRYHKSYMLIRLLSEKKEESSKIPNSPVKAFQPIPTSIKVHDISINCPHGENKLLKFLVVFSS